MKKIGKIFCLSVILIIFSFYSEANHPLRVHPDNWRYFTDDSGKTIVFSGSHTWARSVDKKRWLSDGWDIAKFNKYLDFLEYWNHNFIRLWMWEHEGDIDIWTKVPDGKYDLSKLNQAYFDRVYSFVEAAKSRGIYVGVMLFQGWSGCCEASIPNWPYHPMNKDKNVNGVDGDPEGIGYGNKVHSLEYQMINRFQELYVAKMIETLNGFDNIIWEIGNETIKSSIPWKTHMTGFIRGYEVKMPRQHLIWDGTGNGVGNNAIWLTGPDTFSPCVIRKWAALDEPYIGNPPMPDERAARPIILDNDHLGNHFLRHSALDQRNWTWKAFTRGHHPIHMDCYDVFWDGEAATPNHPIEGIATNPHYDPQRKSMGDILRFADKINLDGMIPTDDSTICSTTFCLANFGNEYLAYQPLIKENLTLKLEPGNYNVETFDTIDNSSETTQMNWQGGLKTFTKPVHVDEDWVMHIKSIE